MGKNVAHIKAFGKTILFGEHFVVHGFPAIVSAINHTLHVDLQKHTHYIYTDNTNKFPGVPPLTWNICKEPIMAVLNALDITTPLHITLSGDLPIPHSGIGSSAASLVAFVRALNKTFALNLSQEQINDLAFLGETHIHGTPSGIDNTAATYGGTFWFQSTPNTIRTIPLKHTLPIVLAESGRQTDTKAVVRAVTNLMRQNPQKTKPIVNRYKTILHNAYDALLAHNMQEIGTLMDQNHTLLQALTVSCPEIEEIRAIAKSHGALGAKVTGTGRGGLALALAPDTQTQHTIAAALEQAGYATLTTEIKPQECLAHPMHA